MLSPDDFKQDQTKSIDKLYENDEVLFVAPKGFGKCVVAYTAIYELLQDKVLNRVLVLSTAQVCTEVWEGENKKWSHLLDASVVCLTGNNAKKREELMAQNTKIVICNFENLAWLMTNYPKNDFDGLLIDEITKLKSVGGVGYKKLRFKTKNFKWRVGMTADPVAQNRIEIYGQMLLIDLGKRLGRNKENFQRKYFMQTDYMGRIWEPQPGGLERLTADVSDLLYTVDSTEYEAGLPKLNDYAIEVELPPAIRKHYTQLVRHKIVNINGLDVEAPNAGILQGKLQQICCGAVYRSNEDDLDDEVKTTTKTLVPLHDVKTDALIELRKTIDTPVLIAYQFSFQRDALIAQYNAPVYSAKLSKKKKKQLMLDWNAGLVPEMLVHAKSAGHGLNLQYGPCFSLICMTYFWSADEWDQLLGRLRRRGQKSLHVDRYTIFCRNTVEDCVMKPTLDGRVEDAEIFHGYLLEYKS